MESLELSLSSLSVSGRCPPSDSAYLLHLSVAPPPGDSAAVACSDFSLRLHDRRTLRLLRTLSGHGGPVSALRFRPRSADGLYSASLDGTVRLWDVRRREDDPAQVFRSDGGHVFAGFDVSCGETLLCAGTEQVNGEDSFLVFWDARKPGAASLGVYSESHSDDITQVRFHPTDKDRLASGSTDGLVNVFDVSKGSEEDALVGTCNGESSVSALCWLDLERLLCVSHDEGLRLWDLKSLDTEDELTVYSTRDARSAGTSTSTSTSTRDARSAGTSTSTRDARSTGTSTSTRDARSAAAAEGHRSSGSAVDYLIGGCWVESEGRVLVVGGSGGGDVHLFTCDRRGLNPVRTLEGGHSATVRCFHFDSHSLLTGGEDGALLSWSPEDGGSGTDPEPESCGGGGGGHRRQRRPDEEEQLQDKRPMKSESVMRLKSRPHKKHKFSRYRKNT